MTGDRKTAEALNKIEKIVGAPPKLRDLFRARDLWERIHGYWWTLSEEMARENAGSQSIRILDFDLIYPTLWESQLTHPTQLIRRRFSFPMTISFVINNTRRPFTIPPGAQIELERSFEELRKKFYLSGNVVIEQWRKLQAELESGRFSAAKTQSLIQTLKDHSPEFYKEVSELIENGIRLERLQAILRHDSYRSWGEIVSETQKEANPQEIEKVWHLLNENPSRQKFTINNFFDAINLVSYYTLLEDQANSHNPKFLPFLASGTQIVLDYDEFPERLRLIEGMTRNRSIKPVTPHYLTFATIVELYTDYNSAAMNTIIKDGIRITQSLMDKWLQFTLGDLRRLSFGTDKRNKMGARLSEFVRFESFREFCHVYNEWQDHLMEGIGNTFIEVTQTDRLLTSNFNSSIENVIARLSRQANAPAIEVNSEPDVETVVWDEEITAVQSFLTAQSKFGFDSPHDPGGNRKSDGYLNKVVRAEAWAIPREGECAVDNNLSEGTSVRISVSLRHISRDLFEWEREIGENYQLCCWKHKSDIDALLKAAAHFISDVDSELSKIRMIVFSDNCRSEIQLEIGESAGWKDELLKITPDPSYVRIEFGKSVVLFDIKPVALSSAPEAAVMYETVHEEVATFFQATSSVDIGTEIITPLLREYSNNFTDQKWLTELLDSGRGEALTIGSN